MLRVIIGFEKIRDVVCLKKKNVGFMYETEKYRFAEKLNAMRTRVLLRKLGIVFHAAWVINRG